MAITLERSREQMLNGLLSLPAVVGEVFRSLDTTPFLHAVVINTRFIRIRISLAGKSSFPVQVLPSQNRHGHDYEQNGYLGVLYRPSWL